jgi:hypothetical protein
MTPGEFIFPGHSFFIKSSPFHHSRSPFVILAYAGIQGVMKTKHGPPLFSEGDYGGGEVGDEGPLSVILA